MMQKEALKEFSEITNELIQLISPLSNEQLNKVPFEGSWTAGQLGDHLLKSYSVGNALNGKTIPTERPFDEKVKGIRDTFLNFDLKFNPPKFIIPSNDYIQKESLVSGLKAKTAFISDFIERHDDFSLTCLDFELPGAGKVTQFELIQFMTVHTQRHVRQLKNIIAKLN